jgi:hypothetical protein
MERFCPANLNWQRQARRFFSEFCPPPSQWHAQLRLWLLSISYNETVGIGPMNQIREAQNQCSGSGNRCLFDPGMVKKSRSRSGIIFPRAWKQYFELKILKFFDAVQDPESGIFLPWIRTLEKFGSGYATLANSQNFCFTDRRRAIG